MVIVSLVHTGKQHQKMLELSTGLHLYNREVRIRNSFADRWMDLFTLSGHPVLRGVEQSFGERKAGAEDHEHNEQTKNTPMTLHTFLSPISLLLLGGGFRHIRAIDGIGVLFVMGLLFAHRDRLGPTIIPSALAADGWSS